MEKTQLSPVGFHGMQNANMENIDPNPFDCDYTLQGTIKSLYYPISLWVVGGSPNPLDVKQAVDFLQQGRHKIGTLVCQNLIWHSYAGEQVDQLLSDSWSFHTWKCYCLWVVCGIQSQIVNMNLFPLCVQGSGPTKSIAIHWNGCLIKGMETILALVGYLGLFF